MDVVKRFHEIRKETGFGDAACIAASNLVLAEVMQEKQALTVQEEWDRYWARIGLEAPPIKESRRDPIAEPMIQWQTTDPPPMEAT